MKVRFKILGILLLLIIILTFITFSLKDFENNGLDIQNRIGEEVSTSNITINEYVLLTEKTIGLYFYLLQNNMFESAYALLSPEYKEMISYETFTQSVKDIDYSDYHITQLVHKTQNMYIADVSVGDMTNKILVILGNDSFSIVPEPFLKYISLNKKINKQGVQYELKGYQINTDSCIFDVKITNNTNEDVLIQSNLILESGYWINAQNNDLTISAKGENVVSFYFATNIDFPVELQIIRKIDQKDRIYQFKLD